MNSQEGGPFAIPERARAEIKTADAQRAAREARERIAVLEEVERRKAAMLGQYAGFVCAYCKRPIDDRLRGDHIEDCPLA